MPALATAQFKQVTTGTYTSLIIIGNISDNIYNNNNNFINNYSKILKKIKLYTKSLFITLNFFFFKE